MGVCLHYKTVEVVSAAVADTIEAELAEVWQGQPWILCEAPHFQPIDGDGTLRGWSKLNLHPDSEELAEAKEVVTEVHDLRALLEALCRWSARFGLTWRLEIEGELIGEISDGSCDGHLYDAMDAMAELAQGLGQLDPFDFLVDEKDRPGGPELRIWPDPTED